MIYTFRFKVKTDSYDGEEIISFGLTWGESYADAMKRIEEYYGPTLLSVEKLAMIADSGVVEFPDGTEDTIDKIEKDFIW
jgi:hypothetical protein